MSALTTDKLLLSFRVTLVGVVMYRASDVVHGGTKKNEEKEQKMSRGFVWSPDANTNTLLSVPPYTSDSEAYLSTIKRIQRGPHT